MKKSLVILSVFAVGISYAQKTTEIPVFKTDKEKSEWIQQNPELYNQPTKEREFTSVEEKRAFTGEEVKNEGLTIQSTSFHSDPVRERVIVADDSSFPTYISTGNKQLDEETYAAKKAEWVEKNASKYEKMITKSTDDAEVIRAEERKESNNPKN